MIPRSEIIPGSSAAAWHFGKTDKQARRLIQAVIFKATAPLPRKLRNSFGRVYLRHMTGFSEYHSGRLADTTSTGRRITDRKPANIEFVLEAGDKLGAEITLNKSGMWDPGPRSRQLWLPPVLMRVQFLDWREVLAFAVGMAYGDAHAIMENVPVPWQNVAAHRMGLECLAEWRRGAGAEGLDAVHGNHYRGQVMTPRKSGTP